jgi:hypothetical protein
MSRPIERSAKAGCHPVQGSSPCTSKETTELPRFGLEPLSGETVEAGDQLLGFGAGIACPCGAARSTDGKGIPPHQRRHDTVVARVQVVADRGLDRCWVARGVRATVSSTRRWKLSQSTCSTPSHQSGRNTACTLNSHRQGPQASNRLRRARGAPTASQVEVLIEPANLSLQLSPAYAAFAVSCTWELG